MRVNLLHSWVLLKYSAAMHFCQGMAAECFQGASCTTNLTSVCTLKVQERLVKQIFSSHLLSPFTAIFEAVVQSHRDSLCCGTWPNLVVSCWVQGYQILAQNKHIRAQYKQPSQRRKWRKFFFYILRLTTKLLWLQYCGYGHPCCTCVHSPTESIGGWFVQWQIQ